jgi:hypothetical protein
MGTYISDDKVYELFTKVDDRILNMNGDLWNILNNTPMTKKSFYLNDMNHMNDTPINLPKVESKANRKM